MSKAEIMIQTIVETIESISELEGMKVQRGGTVEGRTDSYPVDLFLEFNDEHGVHYKVVIDTKSIERNLDKQQLFHFANVLQDISGQVKGIIFTRPIYDKLIQDVAKDVGIMLYEVRDQEEHPLWEPDIFDVDIDIDKEWAKAEKAKYDLEDTHLQSGGNPRYLYLYDDDENCIDTIEGIFSEEVRSLTEAKSFETANIVRSFADRNVYLKTDHPLITRVKLNGISFSVRFRNVAVLDGEEIVRKILRAAFSMSLN